jgi:hypothetical protein
MVVQNRPYSYPLLSTEVAVRLPRTPKRGFRAEDAIHFALAKKGDRNFK